MVKPYRCFYSLLLLVACSQEMYAGKKKVKEETFLQRELFTEKKKKGRTSKRKKHAKRKVALKRGVEKTSILLAASGLAGILALSGGTTLFLWGKTSNDSFTEEINTLSFVEKSTEEQKEKARNYTDLIESESFIRMSLKDERDITIAGYARVYGSKGDIPKVILEIIKAFVYTTQEKYDRKSFSMIMSHYQKEKRTEWNEDYPTLSDNYVALNRKNHYSNHFYAVGENSIAYVENQKKLIIEKPTKDGFLRFEKSFGEKKVKILSCNYHTLLFTAKNKILVYKNCKLLKEGEKAKLVSDYKEIAFINVPNQKEIDQVFLKEDFIYGVWGGYGRNSDAVLYQSIFRYNKKTERLLEFHIDRISLPMWRGIRKEYKVSPHPSNKDQVYVIDLLEEPIKDEKEEFITDGQGYRRQIMNYSHVALWDIVQQREIFKIQGLLFADIDFHATRILALTTKGFLCRYTLPRKANKDLKTDTSISKKEYKSHTLTSDGSTVILYYTKQNTSYLAAWSQSDTEIKQLWHLSLGSIDVRSIKLTPDNEFLLLLLENLNKKVNLEVLSMREIVKQKNNLSLKSELAHQVPEGNYIHLSNDGSVIAVGSKSRYWPLFFIIKNGTKPDNPLTIF